MFRKCLAVIAVLALPPATIPLTTASAKELTSTRSQPTCAANNSQRLRSATPPPQHRENRRVLIGWPPKIKRLNGEPM